MNKEVEVGWWMDATALQVARRKKAQKLLAGQCTRAATLLSSVLVTFRLCCSKLCSAGYGTVPEKTTDTSNRMHACVRRCWGVDGDGDCLDCWMDTAAAVAIHHTPSLAVALSSQFRS